jgi:hypothetical protein
MPLSPDEVQEKCLSEAVVRGLCTHVDTELLRYYGDREEVSGACLVTLPPGVTNEQAEEVSRRYRATGWGAMVKVYNAEPNSYGLSLWPDVTVAAEDEKRLLRATGDGRCSSPGAWDAGSAV